MGKVKANGIQFYYETYGDGEPLVLIEGLGYSSWMWYKQTDELAKYLKVIVFDNRGVGKSDKPDEEYTIELFADDTAEVLTALGIKRAHIFGVSMGGFVAQEFALKYPEMVDKLVLCSTSFGGPNSIPIPKQTLALMMKGGGTYNSIEEIKEAIATGLNKGTIAMHDEILHKIIKEKSTDHQPKYAYQRQLMAGASFNAEESVSRIKAETLILAGKGDQVVPWENSVLLNKKIADSRLEIINNAGHLFFMEEPAKTNEIITKFLLNKINSPL